MYDNVDERLRLYGKVERYSAAIDDRKRHRLHATLVQTDQARQRMQHLHNELRCNLEL